MGARRRKQLRKNSQDPLRGLVRVLKRVGATGACISRQGLQLAAAYAICGSDALEDRCWCVASCLWVGLGEFADLGCDSADLVTRSAGEFDRVGGQRL